MFWLSKRILGVALMGLGTVATSQAVVFGQTDDFEDGTTQGWISALLGAPNPNPPVNVGTGGPAGTDDSYLLITSNGLTGPGGRLVSMNLSQWSGDYTTAGVTTITMDVKNFGNDDLNLRLLFETVGGQGPSDIATTTNSVFLAGGSGWTTVQFDISADDLTSLLGSVDTALSSASVLRIFNSPTASFPPVISTSSLGVDNVHAVPEPASLAAMVGGLAFLARRRRRQS
jgi:hypothetical protein